jgi:hypothetical protein
MGFGCVGAGGGGWRWVWAFLGVLAFSTLPLVAPGCERRSTVLSSGRDSSVPLCAAGMHDHDAGRGRGTGGWLLRLRGGDDEEKEKAKVSNKPWLESSWEEEHLQYHPDHLMMRPDLPDLYGIPRDGESSSPEPEFQTTDERIDYIARKVRDAEFARKKREEDGLVTDEEGEAEEEVGGEEAEEEEEEEYDCVPSSDDKLRADPDDETAPWYKRGEFPRTRRNLHEYALRLLQEQKAEEREAAMNRTEPDSYYDISDLVIDSEDYAYYEDEKNLIDITPEDVFQRPPGPNREEDQETIAKLRRSRWIEDKPWQKKQMAMIEEHVEKRKFTDKTCLSAVGNVNALGQQLIVASRTGDFETMEKLIQGGVNPNFQDYCRDTALHWACIAGQWRSVRLLLGAGADPELKTEMGRTALHQAAAGQVKTDGFTTQGHRGVRAIFSARTKVSRRFSLSLMFLSLLLQDLRVLHELLKSGCSTTVEDWSGYTPLDIAYTIKQNNKVEVIRPTEVVRLLESAGSTRCRCKSLQSCTHTRLMYFLWPLLHCLIHTLSIPSPTNCLSLYPAPHPPPPPPQPSKAVSNASSKA